jgi:AcrR family transcriptional regulator
MTGSQARPEGGNAVPATATLTHRIPRAARRVQLLGIATRLFAAHGYHHISMDDLADEAGVSKPVLYRHFPSKLELYLEVVDARGAELVAAVDAALAPARDADPSVSFDGGDVVQAVVEAYVSFAVDAGQSAALLFESDVMRDDAVRERVLRPDAVNADAFADVLVLRCGMDREQALVLGRTCTAIARSAATEVAEQARLAARRKDHGGRGGRGVDDATISSILSTFAWRGLRSFVAPAT